MKSFKEFLNENSAIKVEFSENNNVVEVTDFDSVDDLLNDKIDEIGTKLRDILSNRQITMLKNGRKVRYRNYYSSNNGVKIIGRK